ncbi:MAG TPA: ATP-binding cassette domain-containing protein, partial [Holophaga sp.]|nr:ATP-binding cassette domain-containing protein [Holophaga sp.]
RFGPVPVLEDIDLDLPAGRSLAIVGPSGCGKTTLLRCVAGLEEPDRGTIRLGDGWLWQAGRSVAPSARGIAMAFQQPCLWPHMTVAANIAFAVSHLPRREAAERVAWAMALCSVEPFRHRHPSELSGGQARRVSLARALAPRAPLLLLDEPLVHLDADSRQAAREALRVARREHPAALLLVTHDRAEAEDLCEGLWSFPGPFSPGAGGS